MTNLDWDDLRMFLAIARAGSLSRAAERSRVNQSTLSRRLTRMEQRLGVRLFDRLPRGLALTAEGETALARVEALDAEVIDLEKQLSGRDTRLSGRVLLATADTLCLHIMPMLAEFSAAHPEVRVQLTTSNHEINLLRREADIVLRATNRPPETAFGRRLAAMAVATYLRRCDQRRAAKLSLIDFDMGTGLFDALKSKSSTAVASFDSVWAVREAVLAGMGKAVLPCFIGDRHPDLVRETGSLRPRINELWLLTSSELRGSARIRALLRHLGEGLEAQRDLFEGRLSNKARRR